MQTYIFFQNTTHQQSNFLPYPRLDSEQGVNLVLLLLLLLMAIMQNTLNYRLLLNFNRFPRCVLSTEKRDKKVRIVAYSFYEDSEKIPTTSPVARIGRPTSHERKIKINFHSKFPPHIIWHVHERWVVNFCCDKKQIARTVKIVPKIDLYLLEI